MSLAASQLQIEVSDETEPSGQSDHLPEKDRDLKSKLFVQWELEPGEGGPEDEINLIWRKTKKRFAVNWVCPIGHHNAWHGTIQSPMHWTLAHMGRPLIIVICMFVPV